MLRLFKRLDCPHSSLLGIFGDAINHNAGYRLICNDCGARLRGPVKLANIRSIHESGVE